MKLKFFAIASAMLLALGTASIAGAGAVADGDGDLVPDQFDNCSDEPNGPGESPANQVDVDNDGFGNICDCDFDQSGLVLGNDIVEALQNFNMNSPLHDLDSSGLVLGNDIVNCLNQFNSAPGPGAV